MNDLMNKWRFRIFSKIARLVPNKYATNILKLASIKIGENCLISKDTFFHNNRVTFGNNCYVNKHCKFYTGMNSNGYVVVGDNVNIGMNVSFICTTHEIGSTVRAGRDISKPIIVGDNCWIGGAIILPGVSVGKGSIIGAGSVVIKNINANTIVAGNPAKVIRELDY